MAEREGPATPQRTAGLLAELKSPRADVSDRAASALAHDGDGSGTAGAAAAKAILAAIRADCGSEHVSDAKVAPLAKLATPGTALEVVAFLDTLRDEEIEDEPDDVRDEYWRLRQACTRVLAGMGDRGRRAIAYGRLSANPATRACAARAAELAEAAGQG